MSPARKVTLAAIRRIVLAFPGVEEGTSYGTPGFSVRGKFLARVREDGESIAVNCGFVERDLRIQTQPATFFTTDHYRNYGVVLVRLGKVTTADLKDVLEEAWRKQAPRKLIREFDLGD